MKKSFQLLSVAAIAVMGLTSCEDYIVDSGIQPSDENLALGIPEDSQATEDPVITNPNVVLPNAAVNIKEENGYEFLQIDLTGIWDEDAGDYLTLVGTDNNGDQNIWLSIDDFPKGFDVYNVKDDAGKKLLVDVVFLVDNSGSMSEEANTVANSIVAWSQSLINLGLDLNVGCVGYGEGNHAINGALNMTTPASLKAYLERYSGTSRTKGFGGNDAQTLENLARTSGRYENGSDRECGMVALRYAHDNFNFRGGANRIYVNFTDESNQPNGISDWSVEYLNPTLGNWKSNYGTVHTVYSDYKFNQNDYLRDEQPWLMSEYTGGTTIFVDNYATDWDLTTLPVTGAMQNSSILRTTNHSMFKDGKSHRIKITVQTPSKSVRAVKTINYNLSSKKEE